MIIVFGRAPSPLQPAQNFARFGFVPHGQAPTVLLKSNPEYIVGYKNTPVRSVGFKAMPLRKLPQFVS